MKTDTKLIIFDMDGLMIDSERIALETWEFCLKKKNISCEREFLISLMGTTKFHIFKKFDEKYGEGFDYERNIQPLFVKKRRELIFGTEPEKLIKKGLLELIDFAKENGIKIAVASSTVKDEVRLALEHIGVYDYFDFTVCGDEVKNGKPDPEIFLKALEKSGINKENSVILEDSSNGLLAGHNAGIRTIFIKDIVTPSDDVLDTVWEKADSLLDVMDIL